MAKLNLYGDFKNRKEKEKNEEDMKKEMKEKLSQMEKSKADIIIIQEKNETSKIVKNGIAALFLILSIILIIAGISILAIYLKNGMIPDLKSV